MYLASNYQVYLSGVFILKILKLGEDNFFSMVDTCETLVISFVLNDEVFSISPVLTAKFPNVRFAYVNLRDEPRLSGMFNLTAEPALVISRQATILYIEKGSHEAEKVDYLLQKISLLDMNRVRLHIEQEKAAHALHMRRACPIIRAKLL